MTIDSLIGEIKPLLSDYLGQGWQPVIAADGACLFATAICPELHTHVSLAVPPQDLSRDDLAGEFAKGFHHALTGLCRNFAWEKVPA